MSYTKDDVQRRSNGHYGAMYPAVNVKAYRFPSVYEIEPSFPGACSVDLERALGYAFESACEGFWQDLQESLREDPDFYFPGYRLTISQDGRSGGWLVVQGLPDFESWDAIMLARWRRFERIIKQDIAWRCSSDSVIEDIHANHWHKPYSSRFNFFDSPGGPVCIADARAELLAEVESRYGTGGRRLIASGA